jgi:hypothetical protein
MKQQQDDSYQMSSEEKQAILKMSPDEFKKHQSSLFRRAIDVSKIDKKVLDILDKVKNKKIIDKLMNVLQRIQTFMFLSEEIEKDLEQLLNTKEINLFEQAVGISLSEFKQLLDLDVLDKKLLNRVIQSYYLIIK